MRNSLHLFIGLSIALAACDDGGATSTAADTTGSDAVADTVGGPDTATPVDTAPGFIPQRVGCGTGAWSMPEGLTEIAWDDGAAAAHVAAQGWDVSGHSLAAGPTWEGVRFDLEHPARVWGFAVQWGNLGETPPAELTAGLYRDFGHNGFDFWTWDPLWTGTRCGADHAPGEWLTYALEQPIVYDHPGLVFVGQLRPDERAPAFLFDGTAAESCEVFDACHSSLNLPEAERQQFDIGLSIQLPNDFMVRLYVEYTEERPADDRLFRRVDDVEIGQRLAWGDYDNDGDDDLLTYGPTLLNNDGAGAFTDVTEASGLMAETVRGHHGGVWGDYDNDGCLDLFLYAEAYTRTDALLRSNCDGTFTDVTEPSGIDDTQAYNDCEDPGRTQTPSPAAAWVDLDADGLLDLYVANFICWGNYSYYSDQVWHNAGDGTFEDWSGTRGFSAARQPSRGVTPIDHDRDGDVDLLVNNYVLKPNLFFDNLGDGTVAERGLLNGLAGHFDVAHGIGYYGHTSGVAWGDLDNDGDWDMFAANLAHPRFHSFSDKSQILINDGANRFTDLTTDWSGPLSDTGLRFQETYSVPALADFDNDGALDLAVTCVYDGRPADFYWGNGDGTFTLDTYGSGLDVKDGWGIASADIDNDGDVDLGLYRGLFENTGAPSAGHWLSVRVVGDEQANRAALGAQVHVTAGAATWMRQVPGGSGQGCQDSQYLHFGLAGAASVDTIRVVFPGGKETTFTGPFDADQRLWLYESGKTHAGWAPPAE